MILYFSYVTFSFFWLEVFLLFYAWVLFFMVFVKVLLYLFYFILGPHLQHMEVPRLGGPVGTQLPATSTATATATQDLSCICNLHHSSWQCQIPKPLDEARDQAWILMGTSQVRFWWATTGTQYYLFLICGYTVFQVC